MEEHQWWFPNIVLVDHPLHNREYQARATSSLHQSPQTPMRARAQVRDLYWTFRNFRARVADFLRYRRVTANMDERFPDATPDDLARADGLCIICREDLGGAGGRAKRLPCNHVFHLHCLRCARAFSLRAYSPERCLHRQQCHGRHLEVSRCSRRVPRRTQRRLDGDATLRSGFGIEKLGLSMCW